MPGSGIRHPWRKDLRVLAHAWNIGLPAAPNSNTGVAECLHRAEYATRAHRRILHAQRACVLGSRKRHPYDDVLHFSEKFEVGRASDKGSPGADHERIVVLNTGAKVAQANPVATLGRLEGIAHDSEMQRHTVPQAFTDYGKVSPPFDE